MIVFVSLVMRMRYTKKNSSRKVERSSNLKLRRSPDMQQNSSKSNEGEISWRSLQTNNGHVEAEEAKVYEAKIDNVTKTHAKSYDAILEEAVPENVRGNIKELRIVIDQ